MACSAVSSTIFRVLFTLYDRWEKRSIGEISKKRGFTIVHTSQIDPLLPYSWRFIGRKNRIGHSIQLLFHFLYYFDGLTIVGTEDKVDSEYNRIIFWARTPQLRRVLCRLFLGRFWVLDEKGKEEFSYEDNNKVS